MKPRYSRRMAWGWVCSLALIGSMVLLFPTKSWALPAFARLYGLQCSTCHSSYPVLNSLGEEFRLSGYRRFAGGGPDSVSPPLKIGERLELPTVVPISFVLAAGYNHDKINNTFGNGSHNTSSGFTEPEFKRTLTSFNLTELTMFAAAPLGSHLSIFFEEGLGSTEIRQFWEPEVGKKGLTHDLGGADVPEQAFIGFHDIFVQDLLNVKAGVMPSEVAFSNPRRLSFFPYLIYEVAALDVFSTNKDGFDAFISVPGVEGAADHQFRLAESQIGLEVFGRVTPSIHRIPDLYIDYVVGAVNGNNIHPDNNKTKDVLGRLALSYSFLNHWTIKGGGFGYYSGNTLDSNATSPLTGAKVKRSRLWRAGPDINLTLSEPLYINIFSQVMFARDSNPTGFGREATWWGGFVQGEIKPLDDLIVYARYDWVHGDRFNDTSATINGVSGTIGPIHPKLWDTVVGVNYYFYQNFKLIAEYRYGRKDLRPESPAESDLRRISDNSVYTGFHLDF